MDDQQKLDLLMVIMANHDLRSCPIHAYKDRSYRWHFASHTDAEIFLRHLNMWLVTAPVSLSPADDGQIYRYEGANQEVLVLDFDRIA